MTEKKNLISMFVILAKGVCVYQGYNSVFSEKQKVFYFKISLISI